VNVYFMSLSSATLLADFAIFIVNVVGFGIWVGGWWGICGDEFNVRGLTNFIRFYISI